MLHDCTAEWYRGRLNKRGAETGIFPKNHVIAKKCRIAKDASGGEVSLKSTRAKQKVNNSLGYTR